MVWLQKGRSEVVELEVSEKVPLEGEELEAYRRERENQEGEVSGKVGGEAVEGSGEGEARSEGEAFYGERQEKRPPAGGTEVDLEKILCRPVLVEGFTATSGQFPQFPLEEDKTEWDEYGAMIDLRQVGARRAQAQGSEPGQVSAGVSAPSAPWSCLCPP